MKVRNNLGKVNGVRIPGLGGTVKRFAARTPPDGQTNSLGFEGVPKPPA